MEEDGATFEDKTVHVRILRKKEGGILWGIGLWAAHNSHGRIQGGRGSHRTHPTPQHSYIQMEIYSDFIQAWRIEKHENGNSFFGGGGGGGGEEGGVRGSRNLGGSSTSFKLSMAKD